MSLDDLLLVRICMCATDLRRAAGCGESCPAPMYRPNALPPELCHG